MTHAQETPTALLLHSGGLSHRLWDGVVAELGSGWRVVAPDLPGFGAAPRLPGRVATLDAYAEHACGVLDEAVARAGGPVVVAGSCMGATLAVEVARRRPGRVAGLAVVNVLDRDTVVGGVHERAAARALRLPWLVRGMSRTLEVVRPPRRQLARGVRSTYASEVDERYLEEVIANYTRRDQLPAFSAIMAAIGTWRIDDPAGRAIACPVRVGWGADNVVVPVRHAGHVAEVLGAPEPVVVARAAHLLPHQRPEAFADLLRAVVSSNGGTGSSGG